MHGLNYKVSLSSMIFIACFILAVPTHSQDRTSPDFISDRRLIRDFVEEEMVYPPKDLKSNVGGEVEILFRVETDGSVSDIRISRNVSPDIDAEAVRIFRKILWKPGTVLGIPEPMEHTFSMKFDPGKYKKACKKRGYGDISYPVDRVDESGKVYDFDQTDISPRPVFSSLDCTLEKFVTSNLKYPEAAFKQNISGTVEIRFVVEPSGRISNIHPVKPLGGGCTEEAIRITRMIRWKPGIKDEKAIRVFNTLKLTFNIAGQTINGSPAVPGQVH